MPWVSHITGAFVRIKRTPAPARLRYLVARKRRNYLYVILVALIALGLAYVARQGGKITASPTPSTSASAAKSELGDLKIAKPLSMSGYSREKFPHWINQGNDCDTREVVLKRDGSGVKENSECHPTSGKWVSKYDDKTFTDPDGLDIDHLVPLANAWRSGAATWSTARREAFANDLKDPQLIAVSASSNRSKGDQDPSQWKPPSEAFWCQYARDWIAVKYRWHLTITSAEKSALTDMLGRC